MVCFLCNGKINILPGSHQDEIAFTSHKMVHKQCLMELEEFELYWEQYKPPLAWFDFKTGRLCVDKEAYEDLKEYLLTEG